LLSKGTIIAIDGTDGTGKTSALNTLETYLKEHTTREIVRIKHPGLEGVAGILRSLVLGVPVTHYSWRDRFTSMGTPKSNMMFTTPYTSGELPDQLASYWIFFAEALETYYKMTLPALNRDAIVIYDRYYPVVTSAYVYGDGLTEEAELMTDLSLRYLRSPDIAFVFHLPFLEATRRLGQRINDGGETNYLDFPNEQVYNRRQAGFQIAMDKWKWIQKIDASGTQEEVFEALIAVLKEKQVVEID